MESPQVSVAASPQRVVLPSNRELLHFKVHQGITRMFKNYLFMIENLRDEHDEAMNKLEDVLPEQYKCLVEVADYLGSSKMEAFRKRILLDGNNTIRDLQDMIDGLRVDRDENNTFKEQNS